MHAGKKGVVRVAERRIIPVPLFARRLGLNKEAVVTLQRCWRIDKLTGQPTTDAKRRAAYAQKIYAATEAAGAELLEYNADRGIWRFRVKHF